MVNLKKACLPGCFYVVVMVFLSVAEWLLIGYLVKDIHK